VGIADDDVAAVRAASDIVGIISQYTQLRRVGRRWVGLCPFHSERTGSFSVNAEEGLWYCFGCQARGDAITFVREVEHLDFVGAVEWLAARAGITLRYTNRNEAEGRKRRARLVDVVAKAVEWYHQRLLTAGDAGPARRYLRSRGLDGDVVREYRIGWAPDGWDELCRALQLSENVARETGLGFRNNRNRLQDTFRARVVFPIFDPQADPVGFGGRILPAADGSANQPKYKNTPETPIYHKSKVLYGLDRAKAAMVSSGTAVICEGYTDVIGFHRCGIPTAVATCGTALTDEHVALLRRYAKRLVLAFDADRAGQAAAERFYQWERDHDLEVAVADLPASMDPADLAQHDPERLVAAVEHAAPFLRFRLERVFSSGDLTTLERRARTAEAALAMVAEHPIDLVRDQYLMDVAGRCRIEPERLRPRLEALRRQSDRRRKRQPRPSGPAGPPHDDTPGSPGRQDRLDHGGPSQRAPAGGAAGGSGRGHDEGPALEVLRHAIHSPDAVAPWLREEAFSDPLHRQVLQTLAEAAAAGVKPTDTPSATASPDLGDLLTRLVVDEPRSDPFDAVRRLLTEVARSALANLRLSAASLDEPAEDEALAESAFLSRCIDDLRSEDGAMGAADRLIAWMSRRVGDEG
jgi:DNA primase